MISYKLIAVYGVYTSDTSQKEYYQPVYFVFDPTTDTILDYNFNTIDEAISFIYSLLANQLKDVENDFYLPEDFLINTINVRHNPEKETLYESNSKLPNVIQVSLTDNIYKITKKSGPKPK